jgi:hypothetical protein
MERPLATENFGARSKTNAPPISGGSTAKIAAVRAEHIEKYLNGTLQGYIRMTRAQLVRVTHGEKGLDTGISTHAW